MGWVMKKIEGFYNRFKGTVVVDSTFDRARYKFFIKCAQDDECGGTRKIENHQENLLRFAKPWNGVSECSMDLSLALRMVVCKRTEVSLS